MCKTIFASKFIDLFAVVFTLFTSGYFHLHAELLSIAHPQWQPPCILVLCVTKWMLCMLKILFGGEVVALRMQQALKMKFAIEAM
jgi:hypothetical protein